MIKSRPFDNFRLLSGNTLKIIAMVLMFLDHFGFFIVESALGGRFSLAQWNGVFTVHNLDFIVRMLGRISFPLFAFFVAEGCRYTRDKLKHFLLMFSVGGIMMFVVWFFDKSELNVLVTFTFSIACIYALQHLKKCLLDKASAFDSFLALAAFCSSVIFTWFFAEAYHLDYGFWGAMLPVFVSLFQFRDIENLPSWLEKLDCKWTHILCLCIGMAFLPLSVPAFGALEYYCFLSVPLLLLYNGQKGKRSMKYFFYIFYPTHVLLLLALAMAILSLRIL